MPPLLGLLTKMCDEIRLSLMDTTSAVAAANIVGGGTYWKNSHGGISVSNNALVIHTDSCQARRVASLLRDLPVDGSARKASTTSIPSHTRDMLESILWPAARSGRKANTSGLV